MRTIYIDTDFNCHVAPGEGLTAVETAFFDGKCDAYIEGYRLIPDGQKWSRGDGAVFTGGMVVPSQPWQELDAKQRVYERQQAEEYNALVAELSEVYADAE